MPAETSTSNRSITKSFGFWQDREIRFDASLSTLVLRENAERAYATIHHVEDTKGNIGHEGTLVITNLRLIWWSSRRRSANLSVGYYCIQNIEQKDTSSRLHGGGTESIFISSKFGTSRFQFVFTINSTTTSVGKGSEGWRGRLFDTLQPIWRVYETSRVYREMRVRSATVVDGNVVPLEGEQVFSKVPGVNNVSKDQGNMGIFVVTNVRIVWFSNNADSFNVSVPYFQFIGLRSQASKFGQTLVIETSTYAGNFILGFRVDPPGKLLALFQEVGSLWKAWSAKPILGVPVQMDSAVSGTALGSDGAAPAGEGRTFDGEDIVEEAPSDAFAAYYADEGQKGVDRRPVYDTTIGLAVEKLRKGVTMQELWTVI